MYVSGTYTDMQTKRLDTQNQTSTYIPKKKTVSRVSLISKMTNYIGNNVTVVNLTVGTCKVMFAETELLYGCVCILCQLVHVSADGLSMTGEGS